MHYGLIFFLIILLIIIFVVFCKEDDEKCVIGIGDQTKPPHKCKTGLSLQTNKDNHCLFEALDGQHCSINEMCVSNFCLDDICMPNPVPPSDIEQIIIDFLKYLTESSSPCWLKYINEKVAEVGQSQANKDRIWAEFIKVCPSYA